MLWSLEKSEILSRSNFQVCNEFCLIYIVLFGVGARINLFCRETPHLSGLLKCTSLLEDKLPWDWGFSNKPSHSRYTTSQGSEWCWGLKSIHCPQNLKCGKLLDLTVCKHWACALTTQYDPSLFLSKGEKVVNRTLGFQEMVSSRIWDAQIF